MTRCVIVLSLLSVLAQVSFVAAIPLPQSNASPEELMEADRAFARAAAETGLEGWMSFMAPDAARMARPGEAFVAGSDAIREADRALLDSTELQLKWEPTGAHLFGDGAHGVTTGDYRVIRRDDGTVTGCGSYVSFWRRTGDGWRVIFDTGVVDPADDC